VIGNSYKYEYNIKKDIKEGFSDSLKDVTVKCLAFVCGTYGFRVQILIQIPAILHNICIILVSPSR